MSSKSSILLHLLARKGLCHTHLTGRGAVLKGWTRNSVHWLQGFEQGSNNDACAAGRKVNWHTENLSIMLTVRENYKGFTKKEVVKAKEVCWAKAMLGHPRQGRYKGIVWYSLIAICPVSLSEKSNASAIFGPDLASLQGKTVRRAPVLVVGDSVAVPCSPVGANKVVTLAEGVLVIDGKSFLLTMARRIISVTAEHVPIQKP